MPVVEVSKEDLESLLNVKLSESKLEELLMNLKCEVEYIRGDEVKYEIERDRPDLFSVEGLARALKGVLGLELGLREFKIEKTDVELLVSGPNYRPYALGAVIKGLSLSDEALRQIMGLQEKLHETYCRGRRKVSIGIYDLSTITPPILYGTVSGEFEFTPLGYNKPMSVRDILSRTEKGRKYRHLVEGPTYPILRDSKGRVLSLPPIINSEETAVTEDTKEVFIDVTGTDLKVMKEVLTIMVANVAERGESIGLVEVKKDGEAFTSPNLSPFVMSLNLNFVRDVLGIEVGKEEVINALRRMRHSVEDKGGNELKVYVAPYRLDILHEVDLVEDMAMAYGYDRLPYELLPPPSPGKLSKLEWLSRSLRDIMVGLGFQEVANYMFSNKEILLIKMGINEANLIEVENPKSSTYTALRNWIIPQLLEVHLESKAVGYPQKVFEIGDVVIPDEKSDVKASNRRHLAFSIASKEVTLTDGLVILKALFRTLALDYKLTPYEHPSFIKGRVARIKVKDSDIGFVGEVHPRVLYAFGLTVPVVAAELDVSLLLNLL